MVEVYVYCARVDGVHPAQVDGDRRSGSDSERVRLAPRSERYLFLRGLERKVKL